MYVIRCHVTSFFMPKCACLQLNAVFTYHTLVYFRFSYALFCFACFIVEPHVFFTCVLIDLIVTTNLESGVTVTYSTNESSIMSQQQHRTGAAAENRLLDATTVTEQLEQQEHLSVVRRQCKGTVSRFLGILEWAIIERNETKVQDGLVKHKACFSRFEITHDDYHDTLDTDESIDTSELWFRDVALNYMEGIRSAMDFLARCSQPPNENVISTDISISEASSATGPAGDIVND